MSDREELEIELNRLLPIWYGQCQLPGERDMSVLCADFILARERSAYQEGLEDAAKVADSHECSEICSENECSFPIASAIRQLKERAK